MSNIIQIFLNSVTPVAIILLIFYFFVKNKKISKNEVTGLFKFIAQISAPAIIINILITTDISNLNTNLLIYYIISEILVYFFTFLFFKTFLNLSYSNSLLFGLAASFGNHVLFVYPIALFAFPTDMITPVKGIITVDIFIFTFSLILLDLLTKPEMNKLNAVANQIQNQFL